MHIPLGIDGCLILQSITLYECILVNLKLVVEMSLMKGINLRIFLLQRRMLTFQCL